MKLFLVCICLLASLDLFAQEPSISSSQSFSISLKDLTGKADGFTFDTITPTNNVFRITLDTSGFSADWVLRQIILNSPAGRSDVTATATSAEYNIGTDSPYVFVFKIARVHQDYVDSIFKKVVIRYFKPDGSRFDSLVDPANRDSVTLAIGRSHRLDNIFDSTVTQKVLKNLYYDEKEVKIVFNRPSKPRSVTEKQLEQINKKLEDLFNEKSHRHPVGYFCLIDDHVRVQCDTPKLAKEFKNSNKGNADTLLQKKTELFNQWCESNERPKKIKRVTVYTLNGCLGKRGVMIELDDGRIFRNNRAPISVYKFKNRTGDRLYLQDGRKNKYIELGDVLRYNYSGRFFYPDDDSVSLTLAKRCDTLHNFSTVNDLLDVTIFSDLLALLGRKPNGIIQTSITGNFITSTKAWRNSDFMVFNFISPYFRLSKFDSKFSNLDTAINVDTLKNKLAPNQLSYLQAGVKVNVFRIGMGPNKSLLLNFGADVNLTKRDSISDRDISFINYYPELEFKVHGLENFGMDASVRILYRDIADNAKLLNMEAIRILNPQVTVYYRPFNNPANKIYLRYANFAEIGGGENNYGQFQFGLKTNLFKKPS